MYLDINNPTVKFYSLQDVIDDRSIMDQFGGRKKIPVPMQCHHCAKPFFCKKMRLSDALYKLQRNPSKTKSIFCSSSCAMKFIHPKSPDVIVQCEGCKTKFSLEGKEFRNRQKRHKGFFCSHSCTAKYYNFQSNKFMRSVSKLEKWLHQELLSRYPTLEILYNNRTICDGLELDLVFPSLQLAVECNGIFHYKPVFGKNRLDIQISNDYKKRLICEQKRIELLVIDTSTPNKFSIETSIKYLKTITDAIDVRQ